MNKLLLVLSLTSAGFLVGCSEETKSPQWWAEHPKEATEKYLECKKTGDDTPNCQNIRRVKARIAQSYEPMLNISIQESAEYDKQHGLN